MAAREIDGLEFARRLNAVIQVKVCLSRSLKFNAFERVVVVAKRVSAKEMIVWGSGTAKFKVEFKFNARAADWDIVIEPRLGTTRDDVLRFIEAFEYKLEEIALEGAEVDDSDEETDDPIKQTPFGYSLFKQSPVSENSFKKFKSAVKSRVFEQSFITFCMNNGYGCKVRVVKDLTAKESNEFDRAVAKALK